MNDQDREKSLATRLKNQESRKQAFLAALLKYNGNIYRSCKACGVARGRYSSWYKEDPEFKRLADEVWPSVIDDLESLIIDIAHGRKKGNFGAACAVLNARGRDRGYGINRQEVSGPDGGPIQHALNEFPEEALRALAGRSRRGAGTPAPD
jgi:hypothetical protein